VIASLVPLNAAKSSETSYAVIIGIDTYASSKWTRLSYAVSDARAISAYLESQNFEVIPLYNQQATKQAILEVLQNRLAPELRKEDRVLVFFAGHGYTENLGGRDKGYIVPYDGTESSASYISMSELQEQSENMGSSPKNVISVRWATAAGHSSDR
jgi:uncharacterized caspase-like protein